MKQGLICFLTAIFGFMSVGFALPNKERYYCDTNYAGSGGSEEILHTEVIEFDTYEQTFIGTTIKCPDYESTLSNNGCAPAAGSIVITYYDIKYENLIPNYEPGYEYNNRYYYNGLDSTIISLMSEMYHLMGTNSIQPGTSVAQFKSGFTSYVRNHGYNISYSSLGGTFNAVKAQEYFTLQQPIVLFLNSYDFSSVGSFNFESNKMTRYSRSKTVGHVVVAYAYQEYRFYRNNNLFRTDKYLMISMGDGTEGYLCINNLSCIDEAYAININ